jgi:hypothetical protein
MPAAAGDGGDPLPDAGAVKEAGASDVRIAPDLAPDVTPTPPDAAAPATHPDARSQPEDSSEPELDGGVTGHAASAGCHCAVAAHAAGVPALPLIVLALCGLRLLRRRRG